ncbi:hypothetical protein C8R45DRAFT_1164302 [Mycena sanguinolenta]|nr:hypothetical protein C8R45DRAFT_1164302 [Mycena sanguinolenta]
MAMDKSIIILLVAALLDRSTLPAPSLSNAALRTVCSSSRPRRLRARSSYDLSKPPAIRSSQSVPAPPSAFGAPSSRHLEIAGASSASRTDGLCINAASSLRFVCRSARPGVPHPHLDVISSTQDPQALPPRPFRSSVSPFQREPPSSVAAPSLDCAPERDCAGRRVCGWTGGRAGEVYLRGYWRWRGSDFLWLLLHCAAPPLLDVGSHPHLRVPHPSLYLHTRLHAHSRKHLKEIAPLPLPGCAIRAPSTLYVVGSGRGDGFALHRRRSHATSSWSLCVVASGKDSPASPFVTGTRRSSVPVSAVFAFAGARYPLALWRTGRSRGALGSSCEQALSVGGGRGYSSFVAEEGCRRARRSAYFWLGTFSIRCPIRVAPARSLFRFSSQQLARYASPHDVLPEALLFETLVVLIATPLVAATVASTVTSDSRID